MAVFGLDIDDIGSQIGLFPEYFIDFPDRIKGLSTQTIMHPVYMGMTVHNGAEIPSYIVFSGDIFLENALSANRWVLDRELTGILELEKPICNHKKVYITVIRRPKQGEKGENIVVSHGTAQDAQMMIPHKVAGKDTGYSYLVPQPSQYYVAYATPETMRDSLGSFRPTIVASMKNSPFSSKINSQGMYNMDGYCIIYLIPHSLALAEVVNGRVSEYYSNTTGTATNDRNLEGSLAGKYVTTLFKATFLPPMLQKNANHPMLVNNK